MTPEDLRKKYKNGSRFHRETGLAANSFLNWMRWGFVPMKSQCILEVLTNGELKADANPSNIQKATK